MLEAPTEVAGSERPDNSAHAAMLEALLAGEGLRRVAEIATELAGAPVEVLIPRPGSDGSGGSPAERFVAELVGGGEPEQPAGVSEVVPIASAGELQGAVVMLGEGRPGALGYLRTAAIAALTGVAMLNAREEASRPRRAPLLAEILEGEIQPSEIVRRARLQGCDLTAGAVGLCLDPGEGPARHLIATVDAARPDAIAERIGPRVYVLLPGSLAEGRRLSARLGERAACAVSSHYREAGEVALALEEAEVLLAMAAGRGRRQTDAPTWDSLRLIFRAFAAIPEEVAGFGERTVGELIRHDEEHGSELADTFWAYLDSNCNMNLTATATYTHRHTVANRLTRIKELTRLDPARAWDRELLSLALKSQLVVSLARPR